MLVLCVLVRYLESGEGCYKGRGRTLRDLIVVRVKIMILRNVCIKIISLRDRKTAEI